MQKITHHFINLTYQAALKSFWRKRALKNFLISCKVPPIILTPWCQDETKRDFLDKLFKELQKDDIGNTKIFEIAKNLTDQTSFPDLTGLAAAGGPVVLFSSVKLSVI